ncbi:MAG: GNAT family N-acetyltransferase [Crocinitomicaceae bacterium]|nr:GNAT family N-acetyltransferase [Crocinitomicaceae bacterium]
MSIHIQPYKTEYREELLSVWEKSVVATHHFLKTEDFLEIKQFLREFDFETITVFCLLEETKVVGFIGIENAKIEMLFLDPAHSGQGWGTRLTAFAIEQFGVNRVDVNEQNTAAKHFYEKQGFEVVERTEKDDLGKDYPLLRMQLKNKNE